MISELSKSVKCAKTLITLEIAVQFIFLKRNLVGKIFCGWVRNEKVRLTIKMLISTSAQVRVMIVQLAKDFYSKTVFETAECKDIFQVSLLHSLQAPLQRGGRFRKTEGNLVSITCCKNRICGQKLIWNIFYGGSIVGCTDLSPTLLLFFGSGSKI